MNKKPDNPEPSVDPGGLGGADSGGRTSICQWCGEPITDTHPSISATGLHRECAYRACLGSIAHLSKRCGCFVAGSTLGDPLGMTKREAAMATWEFGRLLDTITNARTASRIDSTESPELTESPKVPKDGGVK